MGLYKRSGDADLWSHKIDSIFTILDEIPEKFTRTRWWHHIATPHHRCNRDHDSWLKKKSIFKYPSTQKPVKAEKWERNWKVSRFFCWQKTEAYQWQTNFHSRRWSSFHISNRIYNPLGRKVFASMRSSFRSSAMTLFTTPFRGSFICQFETEIFLAFPSAFARSCISTDCAL